MSNVLRKMAREAGYWKRTPNAWRASGTKPDSMLGRQRQLSPRELFQNMRLALKAQAKAALAKIRGAA